MPLFGSHLSVAGGLYKAPLAAKEYGFDCVQLFTKAPSQWAAKPIAEKDAAEWDLADCEGFAAGNPGLLAAFRAIKDRIEPSPQNRSGESYRLETAWFTAVSVL